MANIEQGKIQKGTYRAGKETKTKIEWHVLSRERGKD